MARTLYPDDRMVFGVPRVAGRPVVSRAGKHITVFQDEALTVVPDLTDADGNPISNELVMDEFSRIPEFFGPDNYQEPLYTDSGGRLYPVLGREGPVGPPGPAGDIENLSQTIHFAIASSVWEGDHSLGVKPAGVTVEDQAGQFRQFFVIEELTSTHFRVNVGSPRIGQITLS